MHNKESQEVASTIRNIKEQKKTKQDALMNTNDVQRIIKTSNNKKERKRKHVKAIESKRNQVKEN